MSSFRSTPSTLLAWGSASLVSTLLLGGGTAAFGQTPAAPAATPSTQELLDRVKALETEVQQLRQDNKTQSTAEQRETARQVQDDAAQHDSPAFRGGVTSDYTPSLGFVLKSADEEFSLHPGLVLDFREMTSYRQNVPAGRTGEVNRPGDDLQSGFDVTRLRFTLDGQLNKQVGFFLQVQDDQGAGFGLLDAYVNYKFADSPLSLRVGQFKDPVFHERNLSEARLLTVDRSLVEAILGGGQTGRVQGVSLGYEKDRVRAQVVLHDGFNSINTKFFDAGGIAAGVGGGAGVSPTNYGVSGRGEYLVIGNRTKDSDPYKDYQQFTALGDKQDFLIVGAGADYTESGSNHALFHTVDVQYNLASGWGFYGAYLGSYRDINVNKGVAAGNYYDPGLLLQASYLVTPKIEPFVRYDYTYLAGGSIPAVDKHQVQEFTLGANYYLYKQNVKFTVDATYLPDGAPSDSDALGVLQNSGHNEFVFRAQFQLAI